MLIRLKLLNALSSLLIGLHLHFEEIENFSQIYIYFPLRIYLLNSKQRLSFSSQLSFVLLCVFFMCVCCVFFLL